MKLDLMKAQTAVKNKAGMLGLKLQAKSPELMLGFGLLCMGGAMVASAFAGKKQEKIAADHLERLKKAKETDIVTDENGAISVTKSEKEIKAAVAQVYRETAKMEAKCWWKTVALFGTGTGLIIGSHNVQAKRITGLSLANAGLQEAFRKYQENNIALNGEESHEMCKNGFVDAEDGGKRMKTPEEAAAEELQGLPEIAESDLYEEGTEDPEAW